MNIYVGNLAKDVTDEELQNLLAEYGYIKSVKIIRDLFSGESKGFGFVEMPGVAEAQKAIDSCNTKDLKGKKIVVNEARPKTENSRRGGGGGRGGSGGDAALPAAGITRVSSMASPPMTRVAPASGGGATSVSPASGGVTAVSAASASPAAVSPPPGDCAEMSSGGLPVVSLSMLALPAG